MARSEKTLTILVDEAWLSHPAIEALREKGHVIMPMEFPTIDLILHPAAHNWTEQMFQQKGLLDIAVKQARKRIRQVDSQVDS